ncbi:MAG: periplasmic heavy metal sensor [Bacteroidota bacterium]
MKRTVFLIAAFVFLAQMVYAKHLDTPCDCKGIAKTLKLTPDQEKKFDDLNITHQKAMVDVRAKIEKNRIELKEMLKDGIIDEKKLLQLTSENNKLQTEMKEAGIKKWIDINKMLDKDQKEIWAKHLAKFAAGAKMMKDRIKAETKHFFKKHGMRKKMMEHKDACCETKKEK